MRDSIAWLAYAIIERQLMQPLALSAFNYFEMFSGSGTRSRTRTGTTIQSQDFKSCVSTNSTMRA